LVPQQDATHELRSPRVDARGLSHCAGRQGYAANLSVAVRFAAFPSAGTLAAQLVLRPRRQPRGIALDGPPSDDPDAGGYPGYAGGGRGRRGIMRGRVLQ
jgi:hypothetical protein